MTAVELVLFFGPPFVGKTLYYYRHYSKTHRRISACELFEKEQSTNLRDVILKAIGFLCQGKSVVIDDENWYGETRKSYRSLVMRKVQNCTLTLVQFLPESSFGYQQCLWAREWAIVDWTFLDSGQDKSQYLSDSSERLDCWFSKRKSVLNPPEIPTVDEGFSLQTIKPEFICNAPYKFSLPGLFLQWQVVVVENDDGSLTCKPGILDLLNMWFSKNQSGRVVIIGPKSKHDKEILVERTKLLIVQLASQLSFPIYFALIDEKHQPDQYSKLPHPGIIAFLQSLHTIHLYHKSTMYVYQSEEHCKAANLVGIRAIKGEKLFANSHLINAIYCGDATQTLSFLKDLQQINCRSSAGESGNEESGVRPVDSESPASIPFLSRARKSSSSLVWRYCYGKVNGVCFKDKLILERYQTQYALAAQGTLPPGKTLASADKRGHIVDGSMSSAVSLSTSSNIRGSASLENVDLREVAETPSRYHKGFLCKENVFNLNVEVFDYQLKITCKCKGSSDQPYDVEAIVSDSSGLVQAHCSCPDPVGKNGRCKHVIGLLLSYQDRDASTSHKKENESSTHGETAETNRSLPSWMSTVNAKGSQPRKSCSGLKTTETKKKILKGGLKTTLYCMNDDELLETAKEILEKHKESHALDCAQEPSTTEPVQGNCHSEEVVPEKESTVMKRSRFTRGDVLEELIFGGDKTNMRNLHKKVCTERLPSFAEETPPEELARIKNDRECDVTVIIPDSLVPETVSVIPESVESVDERSPHEEEPSSRMERSSTWEKNQDFLHELI